MDLLSFLRSAEALLYELALWVFLVPKTFVKVLFQPNWSVTYVAAELEKEPAQRYDGYVSPIIFWMLVSVIPYLLAVSHAVRIHATEPPSESSRVLDIFVAQSFEGRFLAIAAFMLSGPLGFSLSVLVTKGQAVGRTSLQKVFYPQCYCFAVAYFFLLPVVVFLERSPNMSSTYNVSANLYFYWLLYAEARVLRQQMGCGWLKAIGLFFVFLLAAALLTFVMEGIVGITLVALGAK